MKSVVPALYILEHDLFGKPVSTFQIMLYRLVSRQPAASASSTEQNQRVPLLTCILIWAYQRLLGV
jgi:hypothetical protein